MDAFKIFHDTAVEVFREVSGGGYESVGAVELEPIGAVLADVQPYTGLSSKNTGADLVREFGGLLVDYVHIFASVSTGVYLGDGVVLLGMNIPIGGTDVMSRELIKVGNIAKIGDVCYEIVSANARTMGVDAYARRKEYDNG